MRADSDLPCLAYSAEAATSAAKAGRYEVFSEGKQEWSLGGKTKRDGLGNSRGLGKRFQCRRDFPETMSELVEL
jgi:hypothetical protein